MKTVAFLGNPSLWKMQTPNIKTSDFSVNEKCQKYKIEFLVRIFDEKCTKSFILYFWLSKNQNKHFPKRPGFCKPLILDGKINVLFVLGLKLHTQQLMQMKSIVWRVSQMIILPLNRHYQLHFYIKQNWDLPCGYRYGVNSLHDL